MTKTAIELKNVTKEYNLFRSDHEKSKVLLSSGVGNRRKTAVKDVSFTVDKGEKVALIGHTGSGRTTLLKLMAGLIYPTYGDVIVYGKPSDMIENAAGLDGAFTGRQNIRNRARLLGLNKEEIQALEEKVVEFVDLGEYIDQPLRTYSGVMRSKLGFAININMRPDIILLDEVFAAGDGEFRKKCIARLNEMVDNEGGTIIFATKMGKLAKRYCERGIVFSDGVAVFDGPVEDAVQYYRNMAKTEVQELADEADDEGSDEQGDLIDE